MKITVTGSIAYDYLMRFPGLYREQLLVDSLEHVSLSFLVDKMTRHRGGVAANIAFTMAKLGLKPVLAGTAGRDFDDYRHWLEQAGVDTSGVRQIADVFTASFFGTTDAENNQLAFFSPGAMTYAKEYSLADLVHGDPDMVIISPNDPQAMRNIAEECRQRKLRFVYDPSQQLPHMDGETLSQDMKGVYLLIVNAYEAQLIQEKTGMTLTDMRDTIDLLVITHGGDGSQIYTNGDLIEVPVFEPHEIKDPTGAGDAYRAGFITGLTHNLPLKICGEMGALCATYVLEHIGTQNHDFTIPDFVSRFRQSFDDDGHLDALLQ